MGETAHSSLAALQALLRRAVPYLYVGPAVLVFLLFVAFPVAFAFWLSFHNWNGFTPIGKASFVGLQNFKEVLISDRVFAGALFNTVLFTVVSTAVQMAVAFLLAFTLWYYSPRFASALRAWYFFPTVVSPIVIGLSWRHILAVDGLVDRWLLALGYEHVSWLSDPDLVMWVVIWVNSWQWSGWTMILYLAGLAAIPREIVEAAKIDGAGVFAILRTIAVPLVGYVTALALLLNVIGGFQVFDTVWVLTGGGPNHASEVLTTYSYRQAFGAFGSPGRLGYAASLAMIMVSVLLVFSFIRVRMSRLVEG